MKIRELMNLLEEIEKKPEDAKHSAHGEKHGEKHEKHEKHVKHGEKHDKHDKHKHSAHSEKHIDADDVEDDNEDDEDSAVDDFLNKAGDLGSGLYTMVLYDYVDREFADTEPNSVLENVLENIDDPEVKKFLDGDGYMDSNNKTVSALIYNDTTGEFFGYRAGKNVNEFSKGGVPELLSKNIISDNQVSILRHIHHIGHQYQLALKKYQWKSGEVPENEIVTDLLSKLTGALKVPRMPEDQGAKNVEAHNKYIKSLSPEELEQYNKKQKEINARMDAGIAKRMAELLAKKREQGVGRDKR
jgi:hypothetical protein